jgi:hypothetical protein
LPTPLPCPQFNIEAGNLQVENFYALSVSEFLLLDEEIG